MGVFYFYLFLVLFSFLYSTAHGEVNSIQQYVIKFVSELAASRWFSPGTPVSSTIKADFHDIIEVLLKVELNTITILYSYTWILQSSF